MRLRFGFASKALLNLGVQRLHTLKKKMKVSGKLCKGHKVMA